MEATEMEKSVLKKAIENGNLAFLTLCDKEYKRIEPFFQLIDD